MSAQLVTDRDPVGHQVPAGADGSPQADGRRRAGNQRPQPRPARAQRVRQDKHIEPVAGGAGGAEPRTQVLHLPGRDHHHGQARSQQGIDEHAVAPLDRDLADWITYRRAPLALCAAVPRRYFTGRPDAPAGYITLADETVTIDGYGTARQLSLFEDGQLRLQILTSDVTAPAAALAAWLRCRWRIENAFTYLSAHHGIDWLCDYTATLINDERIVDNRYLGQPDEESGPGRPARLRRARRWRDLPRGQAIRLDDR